MPRADLRGSLNAGIDAYYEAHLLTGEASSPSVEELTRRALKIREDNTRLFVHWTSDAAVEPCQAIGPATRCFCSHSYSSHAWYETESKRVRCRVDGCRCTCFSYVPGRGSTHLRCTCKHEHHDHRSSDGKPSRCHHPGCGCAGFHSNWRCGSCGETYDEHRTTFETAAERARSGKPVEENLGGWSDEKPHLDAVCGGVTRMSSLLSGIERVGIAPLPITDGTPADATGSSQATSLSSTAAVFTNYDRKADAHVGRLRRLKQLSEHSRFADGAPGHRLGDAGGVEGTGGGTALVPTPPKAAERVAGRVVSRQGSGVGSRTRGAVSKPVPREMLRELAAAAAERRAGGDETFHQRAGDETDGTAHHASACRPSATAHPPASGALIPVGRVGKPADLSCSASAASASTGAGAAHSAHSAGRGGRPSQSSRPSQLLGGGRPAGQPRPSSGARGTAKATVAAVRRERAAAAAESRASACAVPCE